MGSMVQGPVDYPVLWKRLKVRLRELADQAAHRAMGASSMTDQEVHRLQGEYRAMAIVEAEMDSLLEQGRNENVLPPLDGLTRARKLA